MPLSGAHTGQGTVPALWPHTQSECTRSASVLQSFPPLGCYTDCRLVIQHSRSCVVSSACCNNLCIMGRLAIPLSLASSPGPLPYSSLSAIQKGKCAHFSVVGSARFFMFWSATTDGAS